MGHAAAEVCAPSQEMPSRQRETTAEGLDDPYALTFHRSSKRSRKDGDVDAGILAVTPVATAGKAAGKGGFASAAGALPRVPLPHSMRSVSEMLHLPVIL